MPMNLSLASGVNLEVMSINFGRVFSLIEVATSRNLSLDSGERSLKVFTRFFLGLSFKEAIRLIKSVWFFSVRDAVRLTNLAAVS